MNTHLIETQMAADDTTGGRLPWAVRALLDRRTPEQAREMLPYLRSLTGKSPADVRRAAEELKLTAQDRTAFSILVPHAEKLEAALARPDQVQEAPRQQGGETPRPAEARHEPPADHGR